MTTLFAGIGVMLTISIKKREINDNLLVAILTTY